MKTKTSTSRVPKKLSAFDIYIRSVIAYLLAGTPTNWSRLLLVAGEIAQAQGFLNLWYTGNSTNPGAYELHTNINTKTHTTRKSVVKIMKDFTTFFSPLLVRMSGSPNITNADRAALNIAAPNPTRTHHREAIPGLVLFTATPLGGGDMRFVCRATSDSKRASLAVGADSVQICYKIGDAAPTSPDDPTAKLETHTHASFTMHLAAINAGKKMFVYARWYNTKHPELAGSWSLLVTVVIA